MSPDTSLCGVSKAWVTDIHRKRQKIRSQNDQIPRDEKEIAENPINDLIEYNLKPCIAETIIEDRDAFRSDITAFALRRKFEKPSTSNTSCREDDFHSHHDEHQDDDAPLKGEKRVKRSKKSKRSKSTRGSSLKHSRKDSMVQRIENIGKTRNFRQESIMFTHLLKSKRSHEHTDGKRTENESNGSGPTPRIDPVHLELASPNYTIFKESKSARPKNHYKGSIAFVAVDRWWMLAVGVIDNRGRSEVDGGDQSERLNMQVDS
ncbi:hypothetical protein Tco_0691264 [Tanacetum coccineum]